MTEATVRTANGQGNQTAVSTRREVSQDAKVGGALRFVWRSWKPVSVVAGALFLLWQWQEARVRADVLAEQAAKNQAVAVEKNTEARTAQADALTKVQDEVVHANRGVAANQLGQQTTLELIKAMPDAARALRKDEALRKKVGATLAAEPHPLTAPKSSSSAGSL